jgi:hypothetical protein
VTTETVNVTNRGLVVEVGLLLSMAAVSLLLLLLLLLEH